MNTHRKLTNVISGTKHNDEVLYETSYFDAHKQVDSEMEYTTEITESQLYNKLLDNVIVHSNEITELTITK